MKRTLTIIAATGLLWGLALTGAAAADVEAIGPKSQTDDPAFEHGQPSVTVDQSCGKALLTFHNPTPWLFSLDVRVDGEDGTPDEVTGQKVAEGPLADQDFGMRYRPVTVDGPGAKALRIPGPGNAETFGEDTGTHTVAYRLARGAEQKLYFGWQSFEVESDCKPNKVEVTPKAPTVTEPTCDAAGAIVIPEVEGVVYKAEDGRKVAPGTYPGPAGTYRVTAHPRDGHKLAEDAKTEWSLTVGEVPAEKCESPTPDDSDKGKDESPSSDDKQSPSEDETVTPVADTSSDKGGSLPLTGGPLRLIALVAFGLLAAGGATLGGLKLARR